MCQSSKFTTEPDIEPLSSIQKKILKSYVHEFMHGHKIILLLLHDCATISHLSNQVVKIKSCSRLKIWVIYPFQIKD